MTRNTHNRQLDHHDVDLDTNVVLNGATSSYLSGSSVHVAIDDLDTRVAAQSNSMANPMTTLDDMIVGGTAGDPTRFPKGSDSQVLTVDPSTHHIVWAAPAAAGSFPIYAVFSGGGSVITGNPEVDVVLPATGTLISWTLLGDVIGSAVIDIWKSTYGGYPPTNATSITSSSPPTLSEATKNQGTDLVGDGWTVAVTAGDILRVHLDESSTVKRLELTLIYTRS